MRDFGVARAIFYFLVGFPFLALRFARLLRSIPSRLHRNKRFRVSPKMLIARLAHNEQVTLLRAVEHIGMLSGRARASRIGTRPRVIDLIAELWDEEVTGDWGLPSVAEVKEHRQQLSEVLEFEKCALPHRVSAIDNATHVFVVVDLSVLHPVRASPSNVLELMRGKPPDSVEAAFALAVRVTAITQPTSS